MPDTILVADEHPTVRALIEVLANSEQTVTESFATGAEVLEYLKHNTPQAMVLSVTLPIMNGYEICGRVKRITRLKRVPVVLLTALDDDRAREYAKLVGADEVILKANIGTVLHSRLTHLIRARRS